MLTNKEIAYIFDDLANLMELYDENEFKIKSYRNAYLTLRKLDQPLADLSDADIKAIKGIGPAISGKIKELLSTGKLSNIEELRAKTPSGVVEMLEVNGFGPKKVRTVWQEMGIESIGELLYACNENRLIEFKGFGLKTQEDLKQKLEYFLQSRNQLHLDTALQVSEQVCQQIGKVFRGAFLSPVGEIRRRCPVIGQVEILVGHNEALDGALQSIYPDKFKVHKEQSLYEVQLENGTSVLIHQSIAENFGAALFKLTGTSEYIADFLHHTRRDLPKAARTEQEIYDAVGLPFIAPELRENFSATLTPGMLIEQQDLKGVLHVHSTWSDGLHTLRDMCMAAQNMGYDYIGITDHSQSAFYANGLKADRVLAQMAEIDQLNTELAPFKIYKGIESDILNDGSLDYPDEILKQFDFIIASVHSNLKMSKEKATERVLRAVENPYTRILGHPTGRLLLSRAGYELDWDVILQACAKNKVIIELNAHPYRLDIDWTLIEKAVSMGVQISINPDAHSIDGLEVIKYGVMVARKGGLTAPNCLNALSADDFDRWIKR